MDVMLQQLWQQDVASECSLGLSSLVRDLIISQNNTKIASFSSSGGSRQNVINFILNLLLMKVQLEVSIRHAVVQYF